MKTTLKKSRLTAATARLALAAAIAASLTGCPKDNGKKTPPPPSAPPKKALSGPVYKSVAIKESALESGLKDLIFAGQGDYRELPPVAAYSLLGPGLIDNVWGGLYGANGQKSKLLIQNAEAIEIFLVEYQKTGQSKYLDAAKSIHKYIAEFLAAPSGDSFYNGQGDTVSGKNGNVKGNDYFKLDKSGREALGMPMRDKSPLTGANARAVSAFLSLYEVLGWETALDAAEKTLDNIWNTAYSPGKGARNVFGKSPSGGHLSSDQIYLLRALLDAYEDTGKNQYLDRAKSLSTYIERNDDIIPPYKTARNAQYSVEYAECLIRLGYFTGDENTIKKAVKLNKALKAGGLDPDDKKLRQQAARAALLIEKHPLQMVILGSKTDPRTTTMLRAALKFYEPRKVVFALDPAIPADKARLAKLPYKPNPEPTLFACVETACAMPITDPAKVEQRMKAFADKFLNPSAPGQNRIQIQPGAPR